MKKSDGVFTTIVQQSDLSLQSLWRGVMMSLQSLWKSDGVFTTIVQLYSHCDKVWWCLYSHCVKVCLCLHNQCKKVCRYLYCNCNKEWWCLTVIWQSVVMSYRFLTECDDLLLLSCESVMIFTAIVTKCDDSFLAFWQGLTMSLQSLWQGVMVVYCKLSGQSAIDM